MTDRLSAYRSVLRVRSIQSKSRFGRSTARLPRGSAATPIGVEKGTPLHARSPGGTALDKAVTTFGRPRARHAAPSSLCPFREETVCAGILQKTLHPARFEFRYPAPEGRQTVVAPPFVILSGTFGEFLDQTAYEQPMD